MNPTSAETIPRSAAEVLARYRDLRQRHQSTCDALALRQRTFLLALAAVGVIIVLQTFGTLHNSQAAWPMLLTFAAAAILIVLLVRMQSPIEQARRLLIFYDRSILRADGSEPYSDRTGVGAIDSPQHLYERDLDITGSHSVFSLLAMVRTGIGERGLARYLLTPVSHEESVKRQQAVRELLPQTLLRERIALLGQSSFQQISGAFFDQWLAEEPPTIHPAFRYALATTATSAVGILFAGAFRMRAWSDLLPNLLAVLAVQAAIALFLRPRVLPMLEGGSRLQGQIRLFSEGIVLLQRSSFTSPRLLELQHLVHAASGTDAARVLKRLDGWLVLIEQRTKELFLVFSLLTASGVQAAIAVANWKRSYAAPMRLWLNAWAEFEALNAIATYAFEHPEDAWPELLPSGQIPRFEAQDLAHPLLANSIANDISFDADTRFLLISGSNMAGKSTLMRSIGVAAVLAYAGAPIRARSLSLTPLALGASIALVDSLAEGKSKFLAEVERLAAIVTTSRSRPTLFLVDEIFSGTNSADRHAAAAAVLSRLLANGAIGALSTHDLALTSLANEENHGTNVHMASPDPADPLAFDYVLKPGINQSSNALAIIRLIGLDHD